MPTKVPDLKDYADLFRLYGDDLHKAYLQPDDDRYRLLFDQLCRLLAQGSVFNLSLPQPFRITAQRYLAGDAAVVAQMSDPQNRHFMVSDVVDYIDLQRRLQSH